MVSSLISTDPPYYDNISYADLSDYFYIWLRRSLGNILGQDILDTCLQSPLADASSCLVKLVTSPFSLLLFIALAEI